MIAEVIVDVANSAVDKVFDYLVPQELSVKRGDRVIVPFGPRKLVGFVLALKETPSTTHALKSILEVKKTGHILPEMLELCKELVEKNFLKWVDALRLCIKSEIRTDKAKAKVAHWCRLKDVAGAEEYASSLPAKSIKQKLVIEMLMAGERKKTELDKQFGQSAVATLEKRGILQIFEKAEGRRPSAMAAKVREGLVLNDEQQYAVDEITRFERQTFVLFGVTGSGKTEVYLSCIEKALENEKTAILLVPEIALTPQVAGLLENRFGQNVAVLHSGLSLGEKFDEWQRIANKKARVVVGARSAIFAPLENVGVVIVDEEHEGSYNSETNPRYRTEDVALFRAKYNNCPLVLGSATPSIETFYKTTTGEYKLLRMPNRVHHKALPSVQVVDMGAELRRGNDNMFSSALYGALSECIKNKKQALLFLNRRGYTSFMRCMECGYVAKCTDCDAPLVYHKTDDALKCHFCGKKFKPLTVCPECKSIHIRQGALGTQKVASEVEKLFPGVRVFRMDNDTTTTKGAHQKILEEFNATHPAVLVGTQMIAKGHDFDDVDVVGVMDADQTLYQTDFKSAERTFQLITQVSGRAGRKDGGGRVFLQTYAPRHYIYHFVANGNFVGFFDKEINVREVADFPPFAVIMRVLVSHEKEDVAYMTTKRLFDDLKSLKTDFRDDVLFLGAAASPYARLKNKFRFQVVVRFTNQRKDDIIKKIYDTAGRYIDGKIQIFVEINPSSLS